MSGSTTSTAPTITKNKYFSYVTVAGKQQRETQQVWRVAAASKAITIYVQGDVTGKGFTRNETFFAKKHLVTFSGGKAAGAGSGTGQDKMNRIAKKRQFKLTGSQKKGNTPIPAATQKIVAKYSVTPAMNGSTMIFCDAMTPDELQDAFAEALLAGNGSEAELELPYEAVWFCPDGAANPTPVPGTAKGDTIIVPIGYEKASSGDSYLVYHLAGDKVHKKP